MHPGHVSAAIDALVNRWANQIDPESRWLEKNKNNPLFD